MLRLIPEGNKIARMEIKMHLPYEDIFAFLIKKGYEVMPFLWQYEDETFPGGKTQFETWTFTACKLGEEPGEDNLFLSVFEKEIKDLLNKF